MTINHVIWREATVDRLVLWRRVDLLYYTDIYLQPGITGFTRFTPVSGLRKSQKYFVNNYTYLLVSSHFEKKITTEIKTISFFFSYNLLKGKIKIGKASSYSLFSTQFEKI